MPPASGSSASAIARTTTIRRAPRSTTAAMLRRVDAADREPRLAHGARRVLDVVEAGGGPPGLGRRRVHRPDGEVVDVGVGLGGVRLRRRVRRAPDDPVRADDRARLGRRRVVLADVDAVGRARLHEVGPVVEDEQRADASRPRGTRARRRPARRRRAPCRAAARGRRRRAAPPPASRAAARRNEVQAGGREALARGHRGYHVSTTGALDHRAERAAMGRRPSNLIRVVPA